MKPNPLETKSMMSRSTVISYSDVVVTIGVNPTFKVIFTPLEYVPIIPPLSSYVINICLYLAKTLHFFGSRFYKTLDIYGLSALCSEKGEANMLRTLVLLEKYNTNIDDV